MIRRLLHRGLRRLYESDDPRGVNSELVEKTARVLARLDVVTRPEQLKLPGFGLHRLEGSTDSKATSRDTGASPFEVIGELYFTSTQETPPTLI
jgi:proteic killer suppression protein